MSMKARVRTDACGNITIHMEGGLDFENSLPFRRQLESMSVQHPSSTITIDLHAMDFVGSSGIGHFVDTIKILNEKRNQIRVTNANTEFLKVFKLYNLDLMQVLVDEFEKDDTEFMSQKFGNRRRTFEN